MNAPEIIHNVLIHHSEFIYDMPNTGRVITTRAILDVLNGGVLIRINQEVPDCEDWFQVLVDLRVLEDIVKKAQRFIEEKT